MGVDFVRRFSVKESSRGGAYGNIARFLPQVRKNTGEFRVLEPWDSLLIGGFGPDRGVAEILCMYLRGLGMSAGVVSGFELKDAGKGTHLFIMSSTGEEEEALAVLRQGLRMGCRITGIAAGGRLSEALSRNSVAHIRLPELRNSEERFAYLFFSVLFVLLNSGRLGRNEEISRAAGSLASPRIAEMASGILEKLRDVIPVIYTTGSFYPVGKYWKEIFNYVAKIPCFSARIPEDISEVSAYSRDVWDLYVLFLREEDEDNEATRALGAVKAVIKNQGYGTTEVNFRGGGALARILSAVQVSHLAAEKLAAYYGQSEDLIGKFREAYKTKR